MLGGGRRGLSGGFRDAFGTVRGVLGVGPKFCVQDSKLWRFGLEKSFESC